MKIRFLGSGSMKTLSKRNPMSILVEADNKKILLDCGFGSLAEMARENINFMKIDSIFVTHLHCDHVNDLLPILHSMAVISDFDPKKKRNDGDIFRTDMTSTTPSYPLSTAEVVLQKLMKALTPLCCDGVFWSLERMLSSDI